jgi:hypothetical protein
MYFFFVKPFSQIFCYHIVVMVSKEECIRFLPIWIAYSPLEFLALSGEDLAEEREWPT